MYSCLLTVPTFAAGGSLSGKTKKVQESESRTAVGAIKLAEEMGACVRQN